MHYETGYMGPTTHEGDFNRVSFVHFIVDCSLFVCSLVPFKVTELSPLVPPFNRQDSLHPLGLCNLRHDLSDVLTGEAVLCGAEIEVYLS